MVRSKNKHPKEEEVAAHFLRLGPETGTVPLSIVLFSVDQAATEPRWKERRHRCHSSMVRMSKNLEAKF